MLTHTKLKHLHPKSQLPPHLGHDCMWVHPNVDNQIWRVYQHLQQCHVWGNKSNVFQVWLKKFHFLPHRGVQVLLGGQVCPVLRGVPVTTILWLCSCSGRGVHWGGVAGGRGTGLTWHQGAGCWWWLEHYCHWSCLGGGCVSALWHPSWVIMGLLPFRRLVGGPSIRAGVPVLACKPSSATFAWLPPLAFTPPAAAGVPSSSAHSYVMQTRLPAGGWGGASFILPLWLKVHGVQAATTRNWCQHP